MAAADLEAALLFAIYAASAIATASHALLNKRDPRSAWAWITACWLFPLGGAFLYLWFGVNRIERRARRELGAAPRVEGAAAEPLPAVGLPVEVREMVRIGRNLSGHPLAPGNRVTPLHSGEEAYPDMLAGIAAAQRSVWLESYIFDAGEAAKAFTEALAAAHRRGVQVRVLLDGVGTLSWSARGAALLERHGLAVRTFLPLRWWPPMLHINLRDHRKVLVVDGERAWAGGMNISDRHYEKNPVDPMADMHFRFEGPVVRQLGALFADNWRFASAEALALAAPPAAAGEAFCRVLPDGPNDSVDRLQLVLLAALGNAHRRVSIMTPYFIPTPELSGALQAAALRGVEILLVLPKRSDQWWVDCATRRWLSQLVGGAIKVCYRPAPFAHTKLFLVDDYYALVGSANLDSRSLRLNFELMVEIYDAPLVKVLTAHFDDVRGRSTEITQDTLRRRPLWSRLSDAVLWLFSPYL